MIYLYAIHVALTLLFHPDIIKKARMNGPFSFHSHAQIRMGMMM